MVLTSKVQEERGEEQQRSRVTGQQILAPIWKNEGRARNKAEQEMWRTKALRLSGAAETERRLNISKRQAD